MLKITARKGKDKENPCPPTNEALKVNAKDKGSPCHVQVSFIEGQQTKEVLNSNTTDKGNPCHAHEADGQYETYTNENASSNEYKDQSLDACMGNDMEAPVTMQCQLMQVQMDTKALMT